MLPNMFKLAWRNALRQRQFSLLNLLGLSLGLTTVLLIALYVQDELKFDKHIADADRIYRINQPMIWGDWEESFSSTGANVGLAIREDIPEFEHVTRIHSSDVQFISYVEVDGTQKQFKEDAVYAADTNFFSVFDFEFVKGSPETSFASPGQVVLTEETAQRYFGDEDPIGKTLQVVEGDNAGPLQVTGVIKDLPIHTHLQFDMLFTMYTIDYMRAREWTWIWTTFGTYGKLRPNADPELVEAKLQDLPEKWLQTTLTRVFNQTYEEYIGDKTWFLEMQPLEEAYLFSPPSGNRFGPAGNIQYVRIFAMVGVLILLLCSINFMNLSTARSANRAKEVGIRKVLGSEKKQLIGQFIFESTLYVVIALLVAIVFTELSMNGFNTIANKDLSLYQELQNPSFIITLLGFTLALGFAAGSYPALYLSSFKPINTLKGKISQGFGAKSIRNGLVIFQFTISITLILCTVFVQKQLYYTSNLDLGFNKENLLQIDNMELMGGSVETFKNSIKSLNHVQEAGLSDLTPPYIYNEDKYVADEPEKPIVTLNRIMVDTDYLDLLETEMVIGRNFELGRPADANAVIINQSAINALGWTEEELSENLEAKYIKFPWENSQKFKLIGVVKDFNFNSLKYDIQPLIIMNINNNNVWTDGSKNLSIRLANIEGKQELANALAGIEKELLEIDPSMPFEYSFTDSSFESTFRTEQQMGTVLKSFTVIAISIACLGLFGLAAYSAEQRKKELGVRKVLGASVSRLVSTFTQEFTKLITIAILIAIPISYLFVDNWLEAFAYKTSKDWTVFVLTGISALVIAWLTIGFQSLKAAHKNPVDVLRNE